MHEATVCYPLRGANGNEEVLLGKRASLFANGIWQGPGGKKRKSESINRCLRREVEEESRAVVVTKTAVLIASMDFHHLFRDGYRLEWRVHFFTVREWSGNFKPVQGFSEFRWFSWSNLPYDIMMPCSKYWLPLTADNKATGRILNGKIFYGDSEMKTVINGTFEFVPRKKHRAT